MTTTMFYVDALSPNRLDEIRLAGLDDAGNVLPPEREAEGGEPLRCCLRLAQRRERVLLIAYRPFDHAGSYAETGPLFIHGDRCAGYGEPTEYPEAFRNPSPGLSRIRHRGSHRGRRARWRAGPSGTDHQRDIRGRERRAHPHAKRCLRLLHAADQAR